MSKCGKAIIAVLLVIALPLFLLPGTAVAQEEKTELRLVLTYDSQRTKIIPGEENTLYLEVHNPGKTPVTDINLLVESPEGWDIKLSPAEIDYLGADNYKTITIRITPDKYASRGGHWFRIIAKSNGIRDTISIYVKIETATTIWTWIGAGIASIVVAGFIYIFIRSGRKQS